MKPFLLLALVFSVISHSAHAVESATETVLRLDAERLKAMMAADGAALGRIFSAEIVFIHSDGRSEGKDDYIKAMTAGDTAYENAATSEVQARQIAADVVVLSGAQAMRKKLGTEWTDLKLRFMSVWRNESGTWRMIAWQSLRPSGKSR
jgi:ketosteroid isomerase-like protein